MGSNGFQVVVWSQNLSFFLFRISCHIWRFSTKLRYLRFFLCRISSQIWKFSQKLRFSFLKGFQAKKRLVLHVLCPSHPCASLVRTVLKRSRPPTQLVVDSGGARRVRLFIVKVK